MLLIPSPLAGRGRKITFAVFGVNESRGDQVRRITRLENETDQHRGELVHGVHCLSFFTPAGKSMYLTIAS